MKYLEDILSFNCVVITEAVIKNIGKLYKLPIDKEELNCLSHDITFTIMEVIKVIVKSYTGCPGLIINNYTKFESENIPINLFLKSRGIDTSYAKEIFYIDTNFQNVSKEIERIIDIKGPFTIWDVAYHPPFIRIGNLGDYRIQEWEKLFVKNGNYIPELAREANRVIEEKHLLIQEEKEFEQMVVGSNDQGNNPVFGNKIAERNFYASREKFLDKYDIPLTVRNSNVYKFKFYTYFRKGL